MITIDVDKEITLTQLVQADANDIFMTIDTQREYLGKWLPLWSLPKLSQTAKNLWNLS